MKKALQYFSTYILLIFACCFFLVGCTTAANTLNSAQNKGLNITKESMTVRLISIPDSENIETIAPLVAPAVVGIECGSGNNNSIGSGVCIDSSGTVLTNHHVISSSPIVLYLADGSTTTATVIRSDSALDLALLQSAKPIPYLSIADESEITVGQNVIAIGTPLDLEFAQTITKGIISATDRTLSVSSGTGLMEMTNLIQHDAPINPGNSGGPIINAIGHIMGINTLKIENAESMGFAIHAKTVQNFINS